MRVFSFIEPRICGAFLFVSEQMNQNIPATGFVRLPQIIGNKKTNPQIEPIIPVSRAAWWAGVKQGRYPQPVKLGPRTTAWKAEDIRALIEKLGNQGAKA